MFLVEKVVKQKKAAITPYGTIGIGEFYSITPTIIYYLHIIIDSIINFH